VANMLNVTASLTDLNLADNKIGGHYDEDDYFIETPEGTTAIADALRVNTSVTSIETSATTELTKQPRLSYSLR
jgi:hypothetical protein